MSMNIDTPLRHLARRGNPGAVRSRRRLLVSATAVLGLVLAATLPARAAEPLRLHLVRSPSDLADKNAQCVRGQLYVVRGFDEEARGVWVADTLEFPTPIRPGDRVPEGIHVGVANQQGAMGLQIQISDVERMLRAHPEGEADHDPGIVLVGRRPASADNGSCDPKTERLEDGAAMMRRIRDIYAARGDGQPIEVLMD
jgi:hypothetical protein